MYKQKEMITNSAIVTISLESGHKVWRAYSSHCKLTSQCMRTEKSRANFNALMSVVTTVGIDESFVFNTP